MLVDSVFKQNKLSVENGKFICYSKNKISKNYSLWESTDISYVEKNHFYSYWFLLSGILTAISATFMYLNDMDFYPLVELSISHFTIGVYLFLFYWSTITCVVNIPIKENRRDEFYELFGINEFFQNQLDCMINPIIDIEDFSQEIKLFNVKPFNKYLLYHYNKFSKCESISISSTIGYNVVNTYFWALLGLILSNIAILATLIVFINFVSSYVFLIISIIAFFVVAGIDYAIVVYIIYIGKAIIINCGNLSVNTNQCKLPIETIYYELTMHYLHDIV